jgi:hypothetical protein
LRTVTLVFLCVLIFVAVGILTRWQRKHPPPHPLCSVDLSRTVGCSPPIYGSPDRKRNYEGLR